MRRFLPLFSVLFITIATTYGESTLSAGACGPTSVSGVPGCWGTPGCAYVLASALGPGAACKFNYCNCGGTNVPLLPQTVSGTATVGCAAYTTQPTSNDCPTAAPVIPSQQGPSSGAVVVTGTISNQVITETYVPTTYSQFSSLKTVVTTTIQDSASNVKTVTVGPSGVAWIPKNPSSGVPNVDPPSTLPGQPVQPSSTLPLPSGATVLTSKLGSVTVTETFVLTTIASYSSLTSTITTTTLDAQSSPHTIIIGPGGVEWTALSVPSGSPQIPPPTDLPKTTFLPAPAPGPPPSGATVLTSTIGSLTVTETFVLTTIASYSSLTSTLTTTSLDSISSAYTVVIGPGGVEWTPLSVPSGSPQIPLPTELPKISVSSTELASTNSAGQTVISNTDGVFTIPTGSTLPFPFTLPDGKTTTIDPAHITVPPSSTTTTSASSSNLLLFPIMTSVDKPKATDGGSVIPCSLWFFSICIHWTDNVQIGGWGIPWPPGVYPPGPPPPFSIDPKLHLTISIDGTLPRWPQFTIGPDRVPTFSPTDKPTDCETQTATLAVTTTSYGVSVSSDVTKTTTSAVFSTSQVVMGCKVEDSTSAVTTASGCTATTSGATCVPTPTTYVVYPSDGNNKGQVDAIAAELKNHVSDASSVTPFDTETFGLDYWTLPLTADAAKEVEAIANVGIVYVPCDGTCGIGDPKCSNSCYDPTTATKYQANAPDQLSFVSWSNDIPADLTEPLKSRYYFDASSGKDIPVYVYDTGAFLDHSEFDIIRNKAEWIWVGRDSDGQQPKDDSLNSRGGYHGSQMLSLVAGKTLGVAKYIKPWIVRLPKKKATNVADFTPDDFLRGLSRINDNLGPAVTSQQDVKAVVLIAHYYPAHTIPTGGVRGATAYVDRMRDVLNQIALKGGVVVTGSGNQGVADGSDGYPSNLAKVTRPGNDQVPSMLVAGAIWASGASNQYGIDAAGQVPNIYAPGLFVTVADPLQGNNGIRTGSKGTSDAAALTAGLAAYFVRLRQNNQLFWDDGTAVGSSPQEIKKYMLTKAWSRRDDVPGVQRNAIWNGIFPNRAPFKDACEWKPTDSPLKRRDHGDTCALPTTGTTTSTSTTSSTSSTTTTPTTPATTFTTSVSTTAPPPTTTSQVPLVLQNTGCNDPNSEPGHADISGEWVKADAQVFCGELPGLDKGSMNPTSKPYTATLQDIYNINYEYTIAWLPNCATTVTSISITKPLGDGGKTCSDILKQTFDDCTGNGGIGGTATVGCLEYKFVGGK